MSFQKHDFTPVQALRGQKIQKISGYGSSCLALSEDGAVLSYGWNCFGQLGDGTTKDSYYDFQIISTLKMIRVRDVECLAHSLFLTVDGELYGCGSNDSSQLFKPTYDDNIKIPILILKNQCLTSIFTGDAHSLALCGVKVENPAQIFSQSQAF